MGAGKLLRMHDPLLREKSEVVQRIGLNDPPRSNPKANFLLRIGNTTRLPGAK